MKVGDKVVRKDTLKAATANPKCLAATNREDWTGVVVEVKDGRCRVYWKRTDARTWVKETALVIC